MSHSSEMGMVGRGDRPKKIAPDKGEAGDSENRQVLHIEKKRIDFKPGQIYIRQMGSEMTFYFPLQGESGSMQKIAAIQDGATQVGLGTFVESAQFEFDRTGSGKIIHTRPATDGDLRLLTTVIGARSSLSEWLEGVQKLSGLNASEKERLSRLIGN